jgi:hypothetical protein
MKYARLTPGAGFTPLRSLLYYGQRVVVSPAFRRLVVALLRRMVSFRQGGTPVAPALGLAAGPPVLGQAVAAMTVALREEAAVSQLRADGYTPLGQLLDPGQLAQIHAWLRDKPLADRHSNAVPFVLDALPSDVCLAEFALHDIVACPHLMALANSPALLALATRYIGCKPTISALGLRWSFPRPNGSVLQAFHRDSEDWRYLKILVYLTDVDTLAGPHVYVRGSHRTRAPLRLRVYGDDEIHERYGAERVISATGTAGFGFAVDTAGIHKGAAPTQWPRLMLQIQYSLLPGYAYQYQPAPYGGPLVLDRYINRLVVR